MARLLNNLAIALMVLGHREISFDTRILIDLDTINPVDLLPEITKKIWTVSKTVFNRSKCFSQLIPEDISQIRVREDGLIVDMKDSKSFSIKIENIGSKVKVLGSKNIINDYGFATISNFIESNFNLCLNEYKSYYVSVAETSINDAITMLLNVLASNFNKANLIHFFRRRKILKNYLDSSCIIVSELGDLKRFSVLDIPDNIYATTNPAPNPILNIFCDRGLLFTIRFKNEIMGSGKFRIKIILEPGKQMNKIFGVFNDTK